MGDVVIGQRRHICDIHMTPILGEVLHFPFCRPYLRQNPLRVLQEDPAVFCEGHIASLLLEQGKAQLLLQRVDGTTEAGLGDIQLFGRPAEMLQFCDFLKIGQLIQCHGDLLSGLENFYLYNNFWHSSGSMQDDQACPVTLISV